MKKWYFHSGLSIEDFLKFINDNNIQPGEIIVISHHKNFAGSSIAFYYYAEKTD